MPTPPPSPALARAGAVISGAAWLAQGRLTGGSLGHWSRVTRKGWDKGSLAQLPHLGKPDVIPKVLP